jgi:hypothetical protein
MRTRPTIFVTAAVTALGLGTFVLAAAAPASAKSVSSQNLKALTTQIDKGKHLTYSVEYKSVSSGKTSTVSIAQSPPKSYFASSGSVILNNGKTTYYCSPNASGNSGDSGNSGNSGSGNSGNSGNSGSAASTTTTTKASSSGSLQCLTEKGNNPLAATADIFSAGTVLSVFSEAEETAVARVLGIKLSASSAKIAGQSSTCISVTRKGQTGKYCVTKQGLLSYSGSGKNYFEMVKYSAHPSSSLFALPAGATTVTIPTIPGGSSITIPDTP